MPEFLRKPFSNVCCSEKPCFEDEIGETASNVISGSWKYTNIYILVLDLYIVRVDLISCAFTCIIEDLLHA